MPVTVAEFLRLRERVNRCRSTIEHKAHAGFVQVHAFSDGSTHTFRFTGIKSPEQLEDELLSLFVWIWSMKDHLKELARARGADAKLIEMIADKELSLGIASDIANRSKHGYLRKSRSGRFSRLSNVGIAIPGNALSKIVVGAFDVGIGVDLPEAATLRATIEFDSGTHQPLDAFVVAETAIIAWETYAFPVAGI